VYGRRAGWYAVRPNPSELPADRAAIRENERQRTTLNRIEIGGLVLKTVLTICFFGRFYAVLPSKRGGNGNI